LWYGEKFCPNCLEKKKRKKKGNSKIKINGQKPAKFDPTPHKFTISIQHRLNPSPNHRIFQTTQYEEVLVLVKNGLIIPLASPAFPQLWTPYKFPTSPSEGFSCVPLNFNGLFVIRIISVVVVVVVFFAYFHSV